MHRRLPLPASVAWPIYTAERPPRGGFKPHPGGFFFLVGGGGPGLKTPYLRIPYSYIYSSMVIGGALMVYEFVKIMKKRILGLYAPPDPDKEAGLL